MVRKTEINAILSPVKKQDIKNINKRNSNTNFFYKRNKMSLLRMEK